MKCNACNAVDGLDANQVMTCEDCKNAFVAVEKDYATLQVLEAAFEWRKDFIEGEYFLLEAIEAHPDFKSEK